MEDADQPVGQLAQGSVVAGAAGAELIVVGAGPWGGRQGTKGLLVERVGEAVVAHEPSHDDLLLAGLLGHRGAAGVVLASPHIPVAAGVVAELPEHPGAQHAAQPRLAAVDLSVRVPAKMWRRPALPAPRSGR